MLSWWVEIIGWIGAALIVLSYGLLTLKRLQTDSVAYRWMNLLGAMGLIVNGAWNEAFPSVFLNIIWLGIAGYALLQRRIARARRVP